MSKYLSINKVVQSVSITHKFNKPSLLFLNTSDIERGKIINKKYLPISELKGQAKKTIKKDDILFSEIRPKNRRFAYVDIEDTEDYVVSTKLMVLRKINPEVDNKYFYYFLTSDSMLNILQDRAENRICSFPQITFDLLSDYKIRVPEIKEQQRIAAVLSTLDAKIEVNNRINAELEFMVRTLYDYWFVQFDFPNKNGKPYKSSGGKMVWNPELKREIPEGWDTITIKQTLAKESATKKIQSSEIMQKGTIPVIDQSTDFIAGYTDDDESIIKVEDPRIIFGDHTRVLKLINFDFARGADGTQVMLSNNRRMPQYLFYHMLLKIDLSNYGYARHYKFLKDQRIILPDEAVASTFNERVCKYYELVKQNTFQNIELSELRDWLLPMLMNGQVKVN